MIASAVQEKVRVDRVAAGRLSLGLSGDWTRREELPAMDRLAAALAAQKGGGVLGFDASRLEAWDSLLLLFLTRVADLAKAYRIEIDPAGLPEGVRSLLDLASAVPEREGASRHRGPPGVLARIGTVTLDFFALAYELLGFTGAMVLTLGKFLVGRARFSGRDLVLFIQQTGVEALPIVSLISFLIGLILAFVGAIQLSLFGAEIYVANLVGIGMTREMGAIMAAIIMAGRTGAAYAAELGTMQVNEEIDAFKTFGVPPMEYLVLPRMLALVLMMPLLVVYADILGILGGMLVAVSMSDIGVVQYVQQARSAVGLTDIAIGLVKGLVFGLLVASAGCFRGIRCGRSSAAVGQATTSAVVMSIVSIVIADALITVLTTVLDI